MHRFIEDYHERLEESYIFPRFENSPLYADLVHVLKEQHDLGRRLTCEIHWLSLPQSGKIPSNQKRLAELLRKFVVMYRPHANYEDTVLFPALHQALKPEEYAQLGEKFEARERELFGKDGFNKAVEQVATLEKSLGISHLSQFTPLP